MSWINSSVETAFCLLLHFLYSPLFALVSVALLTFFYLSREEKEEGKAYVMNENKMRRGIILIKG